MTSANLADVGAWKELGADRVQLLKRAKKLRRFSLRAGFVVGAIALVALIGGVIAILASLAPSLTALDVPRELSIAASDPLEFAAQEILDVLRWLRPVAVSILFPYFVYYIVIGQLRRSVIPILMCAAMFAGPATLASLFMGNAHMPGEITPETWAATVPTSPGLLVSAEGRYVEAQVAYLSDRADFKTAFAAWVTSPGTPEDSADEAAVLAMAKRAHAEASPVVSAMAVERERRHALSMLMFELLMSVSFLGLVVAGVCQFLHRIMRANVDRVETWRRVV